MSNIENLYDGREAKRKIKQKKKNNNIHAIALSVNECDTDPIITSSR